MKKVLIIDDEPDFAALVQSHLKRAGYKTDVAYDGSQGLKKATEFKPDAVILDVMMPGLSGWEVCGAMKRTPGLKDIAVILLTAVADHVTSSRYSHFEGMVTEADDYLPKPASGKEIVDSLKMLLRTGGQ